MNFICIYIYMLVGRGAILEKLKVVVGAFINLDTHDKQFPYFFSTKSFTNFQNMNLFFYIMFVLNRFKKSCTSFLKNV